MTEETKDILIVNTVASSEKDNIHNMDPLIEPLIDTDELNETINKNETLNRFEKGCSSILTEQTETTLCSQIISRCTGIFYALIASCLFTCSGFIIKQLRVDFFDALLARFVLQTSILTIFILYKKNKFITGSTNLIILQIIRTITACSGFVLFYMSYRYIPLPDLTTCRYTQVVWTTIIAMIIFRERVSIVSILAIIFTLTGVLFVAQPTFLFQNNPQISSNRTNQTDFESDQSHRVLGLSLAIACALSISLSMVLNKKLLMSKIAQSILMFQYSFLILCLLILNHIYNRFIVQKYLHQTMFTWQFFLAASVSFMQVCSSTLTQKAMKLEHPAIISVVQSSDILFAIILQNLFTQAKSNGFVLIGSFLVTTSIFLVGFNKFWKDRKKVSETNQTDTKL
jgi:drug/metabolite transporter (DMT)-like permease